MNKIVILGRPPIRRVDDGLDIVGIGRKLSPFDLVSSWNQITAHKARYLSLRSAHPRVSSRGWACHISQGSSAVPGWFAKTTNETITGLDHVAAYLDDVNVFDADPSLHVAIVKNVSLRLGKQTLRFFPQKCTIGVRIQIYSVIPLLPPTSCRRHKKWKH